MTDITIRSDELDSYAIPPVYTSVPEKAMDQEGFGTKNAILKALCEQPGRFITARKLAEASGYKTGGSQVELRKAITELIEHQGMPIVSNEVGFSMAINPEMILHYIARLDRRMLGLRRRKDAMLDIHKRMLEEKKW